MYLNCQLMKSRYSIRRLRRFLFCAAAPHLGLAALAFKTWGCFNKNLFCHILHFLSFCYDKICSIFVTSYTFCHFVMTKFVLFLSHLTLFVILLWQNLSHFCHILHFWHFCYDKICPIFVTSYTFCHFVMTKFVPFLSHLTLLALLLWQNLSHFCHILHFLSFCYDKICPIFVTSAKNCDKFYV